MQIVKDLNNFKKGIAMIELIFAIVIIGVTLMSAPMLINQSINSSNIAMQQEAITATASHNGMILTKYWDEAGTITQDGQSPILATGTINPAPSNPWGFSLPFPFTFPIYNLTTNPFGFMGAGANIYRAGMQNVIGRTASIDGNPVPATPKANLRNDTNEDNVAKYDDVDDFNDGQGYGVNEESASDITTVANGDYLDQAISIATNVKYIADAPTNFAPITITPNLLTANEIATSSNIKLIATRLTTTSTEGELAKNIVLYSFSTNIGSSVPQGRRVQ